MCENRKLFAQQWNATFLVCFRGSCCLPVCLFVCFPNFLGAFRTCILVFLKHFAKRRNFVVRECNWRSSGRSGRISTFTKFLLILLANLPASRESSACARKFLVIRPIEKFFFSCSEFSLQYDPNNEEPQSLCRSID